MDLAAHNHKDWFDLNRQRYLHDVKAPFEAFVSDLISRLKHIQNLGTLEAKDCIFRINKDVRFSKDKTPYKLQASALITRGGRKNMQNAGLYIELGPEFVHIYTGHYMPEKDHLLQLRNKIASNPKAMEAIISAKPFKLYFGEVKGEKAKLLPPDLKAKAAEMPLIYNKQFYLQHTADADLISGPKLTEYILKVYSAAADFNAFLS